MSMEIPSTPPYDPTYTEERSFFGKVKNPLTIASAPFGTTQEGWPIQRIATDHEYARVLLDHGLSVADAANGFKPRKIPASSSNYQIDRTHQILAKRHDQAIADYTIDSQRRENLSPAKAYAMAKAEDIHRLSKTKKEKSLEAAAGIAGLVGKLLIIEASLISPVAITSMTHSADTPHHEQTAGQRAAVQAGLDFDRQQARKMLQGK